MKTRIALLLVAAAATAATAQINVVNNNNPALFAAAIQGGASGITVNSISVNGHSNANGDMTTGFFNVTGPNAYGLVGGGIVMSTGDARDYSSGPNTSTNFETRYGASGTAGDNALLGPITGFTDHRDVTTIVVEFTPDVGVTTIGFDMVFGSEEFQEYVGSNFNDGFGIYVNGVNRASHLSLPININHPSMGILAETELDGVIINNGIAGFNFLAPVNPGLNTLIFVLGDTSDDRLDTTVYIQNFGIPSPGAVAALGLAGVFASRRRRA
jgi:hypothetical protein